ncbi:hypothetical protein [Lacticaseibacillus hulanensis]|uniref:hypothetical protein n=1 Tax=Lacticaseibacillus hulanensis TaxID=2493111 RepID=UPI000FDA2223|nr:hypothetical protein [Lacticaseibacillus hulanensis]
MPLLIIPLLILGVLIVLGLAFALVAMLVKMLFVPTLILIAVLFWLRRDRQPIHGKTRTSHYEHAKYRTTSHVQPMQRRELHNVHEKDVEKKSPHDSWDDF